jgi:molecular chaperone IbpA
MATKIVNPNFHRNLSNYLVGFDELINTVDKLISAPNNVIPPYPPRNIIKRSDDVWELQYAVAGFKKSDLSVFVDKDSVLIVTGKMNESVEEKGEYLHRGISMREFTHEVNIPENSNIDVELVDGLLKITITKLIVKHPEPKMLEIK